MYNEIQIKETLQLLIKVLNEHQVEYRLLGSVVTASIHGSLHRRLGDVDLLIDANKKDLVFNELTKAGYKRAGGMFAFGRKYLALETLIHPQLQSIGYFWGTWKEDGSFLIGNSKINVSIDSIGIYPTQYSLLGIDFIGIPKRAVATGIMDSAKNKKRIKEIQMLSQKGIQPLKNNYIHVRILKLPFDWLYHSSMRFFSLLGLIRQKIGLPFDPWRSKIK